jgi:catechol-2,3-dioxygenase
MRKFPFTVGLVGHFGLAVRDPKKSAKWFKRALGLKKEFEFEGGIAIGNDNITIALHKGVRRTWASSSMTSTVTAGS